MPLIFNFNKLSM